MCDCHVFINKRIYYNAFIKISYNLLKLITIKVNIFETTL